MQLEAGTQVSGGEWPDGARLWKTFSMNGANIETRLLEKQDGHWVGGVYLWDGDDATLTDGRRVTLTLPSGEPYTVPSAAVCADCHDATRGREWPLGVEPFQLGDTGIAELALVFDTPQGPAPEVDSDDPVVVAARGWLHGNCAYCHQPGAVVQNVSVVMLDFRYDAADVGLEGEVAQYWHANAPADDGLPYWDSDDPENSALVGILEEGDMPPVAIWTPDTDAIENIKQWMAGD